MQISDWLILSLLLLLLPGGQLAAIGNTSAPAQREKIELHRDPLIPGEKTPSRSQSAQVTATINGHQSIEYLIDARTGQSLELDVRSNSSEAGYHITAPAAPRALYQGHGQHSRLTTILPRDGTYRVLIYLMHGAAQDGQSADFTLDIRLHNPG